MFISSISGTVSELTPNNQTRFQCTVTLTLPIEEISSIEPGRLIATENVFSSTKDKRYTVLQIVNVFPVAPEEKGAKRGKMMLACTATPIGQELLFKSTKKEAEIVTADTYPGFDASVEVLDDDTTRDVIHHIAPDSRVEDDGTRIDIGTYRSNPNVKVGMDAATLLRGNAVVISARPRARTTITNTIIQALLQDAEHPVHIVYCDVNNMGTMSLAPMISGFAHSSVLCLNDKFVPPSVFTAMKSAGDRPAHKRAVLDWLDMMILPSVLEQRRHDFVYAVSDWMQENRIAVFRPNEQTVDGFINDIRVDILDGVDEEVELYISELMNGIADTFRGERFTEKNTRDMLDMVEEFNQDSKSHSARRTLYDLKAEIQSVFDTYSKDIPTAARKSTQDVINELNNDTQSSLLIVQGQKPTDILRFISNLTQTLIEERLKRLKIRTPVLFIFNNVDEYVGRNGSMAREAGSDRFYETVQTLLANGRRHGLGFCLTLENAASLDRSLARRVQSYFIGPITFVDEPARIADLLNLSEDLVRPAVRYEDGEFLFTSADSPYHRRVPLPVYAEKNTSVIHAWLDEMLIEEERRRQEYLAQEEERRIRADHEREERRRQQEKAAAEKAKADAERAKIDAERAKADAERAKADAERAKANADQDKADSARAKAEADNAKKANMNEEPDEEGDDDLDKPGIGNMSEESKARAAATTRDRRKRGGRRGRDDDRKTDPASGTSNFDDDQPQDDVAFNFDADLDAGDTADTGAAAAEEISAKNGDAPKTGESASRKTPRGRRGRGRGKSGKKDGEAPNGSDAHAGEKTPARVETKPPVREETKPPTRIEPKATEAAPPPSSGRQLIVEDFDPNAGKRSASSSADSSAASASTAPKAAVDNSDKAKSDDSSKDASPAKTAASAKEAGSVDKPADDKKKAARRPARRRSPRGKKPDDKKSDDKKSAE
ncbi:MAG: hypothetical protein WBQ23_03910 [Bacteroidota bacterium]